MLAILRMVPLDEGWRCREGAAVVATMAADAVRRRCTASRASARAQIATSAVRGSSSGAAVSGSSMTGSSAFNGEVMRRDATLVGEVRLTGEASDDELPRR